MSACASRRYANNIEVHHVAFMEAEEKRAEGEEDPMAGQNGEDMVRSALALVPTNAR